MRNREVIPRSMAVGAGVEQQFLECRAIHQDWLSDSLQFCKKCISRSHALRVNASLALSGVDCQIPTALSNI
jgi:hypothetical protein